MSTYIPLFEQRDKKGTMQQLLDTMSNKEVMKLISQLQDTFKGAPHLPKGLTDVLVKIAPYLAAIGGIFSILGGLQMIFGMNTAYEMLATLGISNNYRYISGIEQIIVGALGVWSYTYLKAQSMTGWLMMFWSMIIYTVFSIISVFFFGYATLIGLVIGLLIGMYVLFELKPYYGKTKVVVD